MRFGAKRRVALTLGAAVCCAAAVSGGAVARNAGNRVTCNVHADSHKRWETVFGAEPTMAKALKLKDRAAKLGFGPLAVEVDSRCSNGTGVYEVSRARFTSRAGAAALVAQAKAKGLSGAHTEDS